MVSFLRLVLTAYRDFPFSFRQLTGVNADSSFGGKCVGYLITVVPVSFCSFRNGLLRTYSWLYFLGQAGSMAN